MAVQREDKRIRRTKKAVREALLKLIQEKDVSQVTTTELCFEADINRSTFYAHWSSPEAVLKEIEDDFLEELAEMMKSGDEDGNVTLTFLERIDENRDVWQRIWHGSPTLMQRALDLCLDEGMSQFDEHDSAVQADEALFLQFVTRGTTGVIINWIDDGCRMSPKELGRKLNSFIFEGHKSLEQ